MTGFGTRGPNVQEAPEALLLDVGGTLLRTAEPVGASYRRIAATHGIIRSEAQVQAGFRRAFSRPRSGLRYVGDGRPFWREVVEEALGTDEPVIFEEIYAWYTRREAWRVDGGLAELAQRWRAAGRPCGLVSNWDLRLRPLLDMLGLLPQFDVVMVSAEVGIEKPAAPIFSAACAALGTAPGATLHVGDDPRSDVAGARSAGLHAHLWTGEAPPLEARLWPQKSMCTPNNGSKGGPST